MWIIEKKYYKADQNYNNEKFDSEKEAGHAKYLDQQIKKKEVLKRITQEKISFYIINGKLIADPDISEIKSGISIFIQNYYVDFKVEMPDGTIEYHEVKGNKYNPDWRKKEKLMDTCFGSDPYYSLLLIT